MANLPERLGHASWLRMRVMGRRSRALGLTLVELVVALVIFSMLALMAGPYLSQWLRNARVRSAADQLVSGLRLAQSEASMRSRVVVFALTRKPPSVDVQAESGGTNWAVLSLPLMDEEADLRLLHGGGLTAGTGAVEIAGPAAVCFNGLGRAISLTRERTGVRAGCELDARRPEHTFDLSLPGADRRLRVVVAAGGRVRLCDPAVPQGDATPQGCPRA
jgi:type IV fimbrial biogenesis protein FimT